MNVRQAVGSLPHWTDEWARHAQEPSGLRRALCRPHLVLTRSLLVVTRMATELAVPHVANNQETD